jgi:hypothetical protein
MRVGPDVGPLPEKGLDETLGLAVGLRPVRARLVDPDRSAQTEPPEIMRAIARAVVREDALGTDRVLPIPSERPIEESGGRESFLVFQDFGVSEP